jgi:hypothetical protein
MQSTDIIMVNVSGVNGTTRNTKAISRSFNGDGFETDDSGVVKASSVERLRNLPTGQNTEAPAFPHADFEAARKLGQAGAAKVKEIQEGYNKLYNSWIASLSGGSVEAQLAKSVLAYCLEFHNFRTKDEGEFFVLRPEDLEVTVNEVKGRKTYVVAGTAVFGDEAIAA